MKRTLKSGRVIEAHLGIIGIALDNRGVYGGYDQCIEHGAEDEPWTPDERRELADMAIAAWNAWAAEGGAP